MGTLRKLQTEIDKTLKKVAEGLSVFDDIWEQVRAYCLLNRSLETLCSCSVDGECHYCPPVLAALGHRRLAFVAKLCTTELLGI